MATDPDYIEFLRTRAAQAIPAVPLSVLRDEATVERVADEIANHTWRGVDREHHWLARKILAVLIEEGAPDV